MTDVKQNRRTFLKPLLALGALGTLGALSLLLTAAATIGNIPAEQIAAAGGRDAVKAALLIQPIILTLIASAVGLALAHSVGLRSSIVDRLRRQEPSRVPLILPMLVGAAAGALIIVGDLLFAWAQPEAFASLPAAELNPLVGLVQGLLYGGITEEILVRWGLLSLIAWLLLKLRLSRNAAMWIAVVAAALLFAAGHLPALAVAAELNGPLVIRTLLLNAAAGIAFGALFVRHNLEAAMLAHMAAHFVFFVARLAGAM
jgi:hypothetical protein